MKKLFATFALSLVLAVSSFAFVGCGSTVYGTYEFDSIIIEKNGVKLTTDELDELGYSEMFEQIYSSVKITLKKNKTGTISGINPGTEETMSESFTWKLDGSKLSVIMDEPDEENEGNGIYTVKDGKLKMISENNEEGDTYKTIIIFKK